MLTCLALIFLTSSVAYSAKQAGEILAVKKNVYLLRNNSKETAEPKMPLLEHDVVETDMRSRTKLFFSDDSILNLGELSRVEVKEYLYNSEKNRSSSIYKLIDGSLRVVVGRSELEVHTATTVAAARGTKFVMWTPKGEKAAGTKDKLYQTCVMTLEGKVEFILKKEAVTENTKKDRVMVNAGTISCIEGDNVTDAEPIGAGQKDRWYVAGDISSGNTLAAFAPPAISIDIPDGPDIPQEPEVVPEDENEIEVEIIFTQEN
jgi:hypothetical protein